MLALVLAALSFAFVAALYLFGRAQIAALVRVKPQPLASPLFVVIPARNEAARIGATLDALAHADVSPPGALSVVVVDDRSSDETARVVEQFAARGSLPVRVVRLTDDPAPGVFGKPRALQAAVDDARARGALPARILFLDADVTLAPGALGALVDAAATSGADALSGVPRLVCDSAVEAMFVPALASVVTARFSPTRVHDERDQNAFLNGQCILVNSAALDDVGGWSAVSRTVLEDVALARVLKSRGKKLRLADLRAVASTRMYDSFAALDEGFGKNATALLGRTAGLVGLFALATSLLPWAALALVVDDVYRVLASNALASPATTSGAIASGAPDVDAVLSALGASTSLACAAALVLVVATFATQAAARTMAGAPRWPVLVLPLVYAGVAFVLVRASLRSSVRWRGRTYRSP